MNPTQKTLAKGFIFGIWLKKNNHLAKAYICLAAASLYGIRAAHEANKRAEYTFEKFNTEEQSPMLELVEP